MKPDSEICPECGNKLVERKGKFGLFMGCKSYPHCKYIKKQEGKGSLEKQADEILRKAGRGDLILK